MSPLNASAQVTASSVTSGAAVTALTSSVTEVTEVTARTASQLVDDGEQGDVRRLLLTVEAAAERLSISRTRMYALIKSGEVISVRVGRLRRVPISALDTFMARLMAGQQVA